jgi:KDO2-lipid IV(A) lauroyltransferase
VTRQNLARAFPGLPERALRELSARIYRHFGRIAASFVELPHLSRADLEHWITIDGWDVLDAALSEGKGAIVYSGHLGNWEIMGCLVARCGYPVTFVVTAQTNRLVEDLMDRYRMAAGVRIVKRHGAAKGVFTALRENRIVAILMDQDARDDGAFVPFFGQPASTPRGAAVFHLRTGAPLIFARSQRLPGERLRIRLTRTDVPNIAQADALTAYMTAQLEAAIRETPEQWFWMHRRWKTRPPAS